jgi:hypothetical protein
MGRSIKRRMSGLLLRGGVWHIDKVIHGTRVCESTGTSDLEEAEALLMRRLQAARATRLFGAREEHTFREAATKYLEENQHKRSLERDARALATLDPYIGKLPLQRVHHDTLQYFVRARLGAGISPGTINRDLAVVRRILNLCARLWRDALDRTWLIQSRDDALLGTRTGGPDQGIRNGLRPGVPQKSRNRDRQSDCRECQVIDFKMEREGLEPSTPALRADQLAQGNL